MKKRIHKLSAALLAAALTLSLIAPVGAAEGDRADVELATAEDLMDFARSCALDTWSQGKRVVLAADIDLTDTVFSPIPTFGGTFDGQGHKITGLSLLNDGSRQGLFRYIQPSGQVQNLTVEGKVAPGGSKASVGALAGSNRGLLANCTVRADVSGGDSVGGIVGVNEGTGRLVECSFSGTVTGSHYVGGVAGQNLGSLVRCQSAGLVNTTNDDTQDKVDDLDWKQLNSTQNVPASTDVGGVAGYSAGVLQSCQNTGTVGYQHVGYNIGGIVGRQAGYLDGCTNLGAVYGRKDVGGIAGQLEPKLSLNYSKDDLERLWDALDRMQALTSTALEHATGISNSVSDQITQLTDQTRVVKTTVSDLTDAMTDWANGNIDQVNDMTARISWALDQMTPILKKAERAMNQLSDAMDQLQDALDDGGKALDDADQAVKDLDRSLGQLRTAIGQSRTALDDLQEAVRLFFVSSYWGWDEEELGEALDSLNAGISGLKNSVGSVDSALSDMEKSMDHLRDVGDHGQDMLDQMDDMADAAGAATDTLASAAGDLAEVTRELAEKPTIQFNPIDSSMTDKGDAVDSAVSDLLDQMDSLTDVVKQSSDTAVADLQAINRQMSAVIGVLRNITDDVQNFDWEDHFDDVSEQQENSDTGAIANSTNLGTVEGDLNVAGVAGSMAVEYDFDPDDDLVKSGDRSAKFNFLAQAVIRDCVNSGAVTAKRDYAGGITGRMDLGLVTRCQSYAPVTSSDGDYVGGVAGASYAAIRDSWVKCSLSGGKYIGGAAGLGYTVKDCRTLIQLDGAAEYIGAVAGDVDGEGTVTGNLFVQEDTAGIDGVSYSGKAEPTTFEAMRALSGVPEAFTQFQLTFVADGETVAVIPFVYGDSLDSLPEIPAKAGCSASWPALDTGKLTHSQTLEAVYSEYSTSLADGGNPPWLLVSGKFTPTAQLTHTAQTASWTDEKDKEHTGEAYTLTIHDPAMEVGEYSVHVRKPESGKRYALWTQTEDGWAKTDHSTDGSYLVFSAGGTSTTFYLEQIDRQLPILLIAIGGGVLAVLAGAAVFLIRRRRGPKGPGAGKADLRPQAPAVGAEEEIV